MTFDGFCSSQFPAIFNGIDIVAVYLCLLGQEERLDQQQRVALDRLRAILYENLSVENLEDIDKHYALALVEGSFQ